jgi:hypothetical protein
VSADLTDPTWSPVVPFADPWDRDVARCGPPALFTVGPRGQLRVALNRTRDQGKRAATDRPKAPCHCLFRDRATGWVQYVLATAPALVADHPRADIVRFPDQPTALAALAAIGRPPVVGAPAPLPDGAPA